MSIGRNGQQTFLTVGRFLILDCEDQAPAERLYLKVPDGELRKTAAGGKAGNGQFFYNSALFSCQTLLNAFRASNVTVRGLAQQLFQRLRQAGAMADISR